MKLMRKTKSKRKPQTELDKAKMKVRAAFEVIVDNVMGENSHPRESYRKKYDKLRAVDFDCLATLADGTANGDIESEEYFNVATFIDLITNTEVSCLAGQLKPERWMFKLF